MMYIDLITAVIYDLAKSGIRRIIYNAAQRLGLPRKRCMGVIFGVGARENNCKGVVTVTLSSRYNDFNYTTDVYIMNSLIGKLPNHSFDKPNWPYIENIELADPEFYTSRHIYLLLGVDVYSTIILDGFIKSGSKDHV